MPWRASASMAKAPRDSRPGLVEKRQIGSHQLKDFARVGALWTRALDVDSAAKLVRQRSLHSIDDKPALDPEDNMPKDRHSARRTDVASHPSSGDRIGLEKSCERGTPLPRVEVQRPTQDVADHRLWGKFVALDLGGLTRPAREKRDERTQDFAGATEALACDLNDRIWPTGFAQLVEYGSRFSPPAHEAGRASIRSKGVPQRQRPLMDGPPGRS